MPPGLNIDYNTGVIYGIIAAGADADSPYTVTITAVDPVNTGASDGKSFQWTVNAPTTIDLFSPGNQIFSAGQGAFVPVMAIYPSGDSVTYSAVGLPPGLTINSANGIISGSALNTVTTKQTYSVEIDATDGTNNAEVNALFVVQGGRGPMPRDPLPGPISTTISSFEVAGAFADLDDPDHGLFRDYVGTDTRIIIVNYHPRLFARGRSSQEVRPDSLRSIREGGSANVPPQMQYMI